MPDRGPINAIYYSGAARGALTSGYPKAESQRVCLGLLTNAPRTYKTLDVAPPAETVKTPDFWHTAAASFGSASGTDLFVGRNTFGILAALGLEEIKVDYVVVDSVRVPRETFATIIEAWRDGYVEAIAQMTPFTSEVATAYFNQMIKNILDPSGYAVWMVPVVSARVPSCGAE